LYQDLYQRFVSGELTLFRNWYLLNKRDVSLPEIHARAAEKAAAEQTLDLLGVAPTHFQLDILLPIVCLEFVGAG
jgi:hypothetical protein